MKVLRIIEKTYEPEHEKYVLGKGGVSINNRDICINMAKKADVYLMTYQLGTEETINNIHYASHKKKDLLKGLNPVSFCKAVSAFFSSKGSVRSRVKNAVHQIDYGYINKYIKKLKPLT